MLANHCQLLDLYAKRSSPVPLFQAASKVLASRRSFSNKPSTCTRTARFPPPLLQSIREVLALAGHSSARTLQGGPERLRGMPRILWLTLAHQNFRFLPGGEHDWSARMERDSRNIETILILCWTVE